MNQNDDEEFEDMEDEDLFDGDQNKDLMDQNLVEENQKYMLNNGGYPGGANDGEDMEAYQQQIEGADDLDNSSVEDDDNQNVYEEQK